MEIKDQKKNFNVEREKVLEAALGRIEKDFGKNSVMRLGEGRPVPKVEAVSTGNILLDKALGIGGLPRGRVVEIFGLEGGGKTTLALSCMAAAQRANGVVAIVDAEHALDKIYAEKLGIEWNDRMVLSQPDCGEHALNIVDSLASSGAVDVIVVDSVAALVPRAELEGEMGDAVMGVQARMMSQAMRKLTAVVSKSNLILIFINQLRQKIGVVYGNPEVTPGGNALKFYASVRLDVRNMGKAEHIMDGDKLVGCGVKVKVVKNKVAPPFEEVKLQMFYGAGFSNEMAVLELGVNQGIIEKSGAWYRFEGSNIGQGPDQVRAFFRGDGAVVYNKVNAAIRAKLGFK